jgi:hypothetical protein
MRLRGAVAASVVFAIAGTGCGGNTSCTETASCSAPGDAGGQDVGEVGEAAAADGMAGSSSGTGSSSGSGSGSSSGGMDASVDAGNACVIGGKTYPSGTASPASVCQTCQPSVSVSMFTPLGDGTSCGSGGICHSGSCVSGCEIGGVYYATDAPNPNDPCQTCQPAMGTSTWNNVADGMSCGNMQVCSAGQCGTQCDIGGTVYPTGTTNPANACQTCQPGSSTSTWSPAADGTSCATGEVCSGATCVSGCFIDGTVYASGTADPDNACASCQPDPDTNGWSAVSNGVSCGSNEVCDSGSCVACTEGAACTPGNPCDTGATDCSTGSPVCEDTGSSVADGTACGSSGVCESGTCTACGGQGQICCAGSSCTEMPSSCLTVGASACKANVTPQCTCGVFVQGMQLSPGQEIWSCDGRFLLTMQTDNNLVIYENGVSALWSSDTYGTGAMLASLEDSGDFVLTNSTGGVLWDSMTTSGGCGTYLVMQTDGNAVISDAGGTVLWASNSGGH